MVAPLVGTFFARRSRRSRRSRSSRAVPRFSSSYLALASECVRLGGKVSLLKNNYAPSGVVKAALEPRDLQRFMLVKKWADPKGALRNPMFERHLR